MEPIKEMLALFDSGAQFLKRSCFQLQSSFLSQLSDLVFPPVCANCSSELDASCSLELSWHESSGVSEITLGDIRQDSHQSTHRKLKLNLCHECHPAIQPKYHQKCRSCGAGLNLMIQLDTQIPSYWLDRCPFCRRSSFRFGGSYSLGNYELELRNSILKIKSGSRDSLIPELAKLLVAQLDSSFDLVAPIPIHWTRRWGRKTVVSEVLARWISRYSGMHIAHNLLRYRRRTSKQGRLSTTRRVQNVKGSLKVARPKKLVGKKILLVDDVMTSGATLNEATQVCLQNLAKSVHVAFVARGVGRSMNRIRPEVR